MIIINFGLSRVSESPCGLFSSSKRIANLVAAGIVSWREEVGEDDLYRLAMEKWPTKKPFYRYSAELDIRWLIIKTYKL